MIDQLQRIGRASCLLEAAFRAVTASIACDFMSKKQLALAISGALVVAGAAYLWFRARPKRQVLKPLAPVRESVEQLKLKADAGATGDKCKLALLLLNAGSEQEVSRALELLHNAAESGAVEAMMCDFCASLLETPQFFV